MRGSALMRGSQCLLQRKQHHRKMMSCRETVSSLAPTPPRHSGSRLCHEPIILTAIRANGVARSAITKSLHLWW
jgi:hypothetical protein